MVTAARPVPAARSEVHQRRHRRAKILAFVLMPVWMLVVAFVLMLVWMLLVLFALMLMLTLLVMLLVLVLVL